MTLLKKKQSTRFSLMSIFLMLIMSLMMSSVGAIEKITYYHNDALGSPVSATDETGNLLWREAYQPYGERLLKQGDATNNTWFTGKQEDKAAGLSYFHARWYDPVVGRFTAIDPIDFTEDNIHSFNRYTYANNNPYKFVDPDGNLPILIPALIGIGLEIANIAYETYDIANNPCGDCVRSSGAGIPAGIGGAAAKSIGLKLSAKQQTTVLGENMMERVIPYAEKTGARTLPFGTTPEKWAKLSPKQKWKLNDGALRKRINEGDNFVSIGKDPARNPTHRKKFDLTGSEMLRLKERNVPVKTVNLK